jgi:hypothetical protein
VVNHRGRGRFLRPAFDLLPEVREVLQIAEEVLFVVFLAGRTDDEAALSVRTDALENLLEARALLFVFDSPRDTDVRNRRHVDEVSARKGDVAGDACAFAGDGVLGDLHHDLLPFAEQVRDGGLVACGRNVVEMQLVGSLAL